MQTRTCSLCKETKPLSGFSVDSNSKSGYRSQCKECRNDVYRSSGLNKTTLEGCLPWASGIEKDAIEAFVAHGDVTKAAAALNVTPRLLRGYLQEVQRRAARQGYAPASDMTKTTPDGFHVKGVSTYYDGDGNVKGQWVKTKRDQEAQLEILLDAVSKIAEPFKGAARPVKRAKSFDKDLLCVIPFGDPHIGMHAWAEETGADFDLKIAERDLCGAIDHLMALAPKAGQALIVTLGDLTHADSHKAETTAGTRVDVDSRQSKVVGVAIRSVRYSIDAALKQFEHVTYDPVYGNHDAYTSLIIGYCMQAYYENEPRVTINTSPDPFHWYRFGKNLFGMTHGHMVKKEQLPGIMACDRKQDWSETDHRFWLTGHIHHETVKEFPGVVVESFRTLATRDAWHHASGYRSGQDLRLDVFHKEHGRINRHIVGINQLRSKR